MARGNEKQSKATSANTIGKNLDYPLLGASWIILMFRVATSTYLCVHACVRVGAILVAPGDASSKQRTVHREQWTGVR